MATNVLNFGHGTFTLGGTDQICQVQSLTIVRSNTRQDISTPCGTTSSFINDRADLRVRFLQDWGASGISKYLQDHFNQRVAFTFSPDPDGTPLASGFVICAGPSLGGDALQPLTDDLTMPCDGIPTVSTDV